MNKFLYSVIFITLFFSVIYANSPIKKSSNPISNKQIEASLLEGLKSDNEGLKVNCAYMLAEINPSEKAIIELMRTLRNDSSENVRIMAALTLLKIKDPRGLYLIKKECKFNDNERTRKMCKHFYAAYISQKYSTIDYTRDTLFALYNK